MDVLDEKSLEGFRVKNKHFRKSKISTANWGKIVARYNRTEVESNKLSDNRYNLKNIDV